MLPSAELPTLPPPRTLGVPAVAASLVLAPAFLSVGAMVQLANPAFGLWFTSLLLFLGIPWVVLRAQGFAPGPTLGFTPFFGRGLALGFAVGALNVAVVGPLQDLATRVFPQSWVDTFDSSKLFERQSPLELVFICGAASIAAPLGEEVFFRGLLQPALVSRLGRWGVVLAAFIFSAMHLDPVGFTARFLLGLLFGALAYRSGSLWPGIGAHAANNFVFSLAMVLFPDEEGHAPLAVTMAIFAGGLLVVAALGWWLSARPRLLEPAARAAIVEVPPVRLLTAARWWFVAGAVGALVLWLADWRGVTLNVREAQDVKKPLSPALKALRAKARRGEVPLEAYEAARKAQ
ncbi:MAG: CPBP family intramembrane metalloprotease [Myxococcaceae bacterium]|nr:CPBP family intramembrane metalloprotease [Myxococcaceae bacterium]